MHKTTRMTEFMFSLFHFFTSKLTTALAFVLLIIFLGGGQKCIHVGMKLGPSHQQNRMC